MSSLKEQLYQFDQKILWLASYPKSGNTWMRAFLMALIEDEVDINKLLGDGIFSGRFTFDTYCDLDSSLLYKKEAELIIPHIYRYLANQLDRLNFIKVHDAYYTNSDGVPIIPGDSTYKAIYIIRNPLDIVVSFSNHLNFTIDATIKYMINPKATLGFQFEGKTYKQQFSQLLFDWSGHVNSWMDQTEIELIPVRYEDMLADPKATFQSIIRHIGLIANPSDIEKAIERSSFKELEKQEKSKGFREKSPKSPIFFKTGKTEQWEKALSHEQVDLIVSYHHRTMDRFGYLP